jgi:hypothetical protein
MEAIRVPKKYLAISFVFQFEEWVPGYRETAAELIPRTAHHDFGRSRLFCALRLGIARRWVSSQQSGRQQSGGKVQV